MPLEPEWEEQRTAALECLKHLIALWRVEASRVELYGNEAGLEEKLIQPVFTSLGWHLKYQTYLNRREPDYALFLTDDSLHSALSAGRTSPDFWSHAAAVADAKAWHISLDRPIGKGANREYPPEQIEWYLNHSLRNYGILTNGRLWRLVPRMLGPTKPRFQTYIEVDLPDLLDRLTPASGQLELGPSGRGLDDFLRFYLLFSPVGFASLHGRKPLLDRAVTGSSEYSLGVGEELKDRVFEALRLCVEGFIRYAPNRLDPIRDIDDCQQHSLILLYRLLFTMYAEDRGLLPYRINQTYTNNRSLARHRDDVAARLDDVARGINVRDFSLEGTDLWRDLQDLFDLIDGGHRSYGVQAYNGGLFDREAEVFLSGKALPDWYVARVLDQLGRASQAGHADLGLFRVDYRDLAIQQLGSVYEGLLELRPRYALQPMRVIRTNGPGTREERIVPISDPIPQGHVATSTTYPAKGIYLATDKGERRRSGSYYTPDHIVDHIVQKTIGVRCTEIDKQLQTEIAHAQQALAEAPPDQKHSLQETLQALLGSFDKRALQLKILDPAMGSGHFLIRACQYIAEEIATNPFTSDHGPDDLKSDESTITYWKRRVAENCLHGVDLNPMAVELAKLALWLETVAADAPLTFLDHHLRCGDSLIGARISRLDSLPGDTGLLQGQFNQEVSSALPTILDLLDDIAEIPSDTAAHVKQKEKLYKGKFLPALRRFAVVGDLWSSEAMQAGVLRPEQYAEMLRLLKSPRKFENRIAHSGATMALQAVATKHVSPFHWELAYPHVFLSPRSDDRTGFDVVCGNPPYDVLSELETGHNIDHLKRFIDLDPSLEASKVGKNNLYKLFVLRSLELLTEGGYLSFIVPMPLLGDEQASAIRRELLTKGRFCETHSFPQKDNPARRVFRDAKLSTTVFTYQKTSAPYKSTSGFRSQVHPAQFIESDSPSLILNSNSIRLYDPENLTIVSCGQADWDVVTSLAERPIARLGEFANFFQGEVNQTIATAKGFLTDKEHGPLITRGANICLYQLRRASQGEDIHLDVEAFLRGKRETTKAFHHRLERVGLQESSPQNNFRRIIACRIPRTNFCNHTINYTTEAACTIDLALILFILNSSFAEWYFRLGSTNAHVSHYQLANLPCPRFERCDSEIDHRREQAVAILLRDKEFALLEKECLEAAASGKCNATMQHIIINLVNFIEQEELQRGDIARMQRSRLAENATRCQVILDKIMLVLLGIGEGKYEYIRGRLREML